MIKNTEGRGDGYRSRIICSTSSLPSHKELQKIIKSLKSLKRSMQSLPECETDPGEQPEKEKRSASHSSERVRKITSQEVISHRLTGSTTASH